MNKLYHPTRKKKTGKEIKLFKSDCNICERAKFEKVSDDTMEDEGLVNFSHYLGKGEAKAAKNLSIDLAHNPTRAREIAAVLSTAAATENAKAIAATALSVIKFIHQRKSFSEIQEKIHYVKLFV